VRTFDAPSRNTVETQDDDQPDETSGTTVPVPGNVRMAAKVSSKATTGKVRQG